MEPLDSLHRLVEHVTDRARARSFYRFLARRFLDDNLLQAAGALSFTTVFAIVPLSIVVFGVLSAFPVFDTWSKQLTAYVFANFVPSAASSATTCSRISCPRRPVPWRRNCASSPTTPRP